MITTAKAEYVEDIDGWLVNLYSIEGTWLKTKVVKTERGALRVMANHSKRGWVL
jgi:hypothetical protein